jgi:divalent metal cation (Fe/Co/Zn/Cd) transporter
MGGLVHDAELEATVPRHLRAGVRVSTASIVWTVASSGAAIILGIAADSIVLVAFGLTGVLDAVGSATLVVHFRHALRHEAFSERYERIALLTVTLGLAVLGSFTIVESGHRLSTGVGARATPAGLTVAAISVAALALLSHRKQQIATRIPSRALRADGWLSATGSLLALVTVVGTGLTSSFGWWWADPAAAVAVAMAAIAIAVLMYRGG